MFFSGFLRSTSSPPGLNYNLKLLVVKIAAEIPAPKVADSFISLSDEFSVGFVGYGTYSASTLLEVSPCLIMCLCFMEINRSRVFVHLVEEEFIFVILRSQNICSKHVMVRSKTKTRMSEKEESW